VLARVLAPIAILLVIAALVAGLLFELLVRSDRLREELDLRASAALGASIRSDALSIAWSPPRLRIHHPALISAENGPPPLRAEAMDLQLQPAPLLRGRVTPRSIEVHAPVLHLVRDSGGIRLAESTPMTTGAVSLDEPSAEEARPPLAFDELRVHAGRIEIRDSSSGSELELSFQDIEARLIQHADASLELESQGTLVGGGHYSTRGELSQERLVLTTDLDSLDLSQLEGLFGDARELSGRASGRVALELAKSALPTESEGWPPRHLVAQLQLADAVLRVKQVEMLGTVALHAELATDLARPGCRFRLDATHAELVYSDAYRKSSGTPAHVTGDLSAGEDGSLEIDNIHLKIGGASPRN
jgi:uncharacterized protein involved in outer membrane biogenesis